MSGELDEVLDTCANVNKGDCEMFVESCPPWSPEKKRVAKQCDVVLSSSMYYVFAALIVWGTCCYLKHEVLGWALFASMFVVVGFAALVSHLLWRNYEKKQESLKNTTIVVDNVSGFPSGAKIMVGNEMMLVTGVSGKTMSVQKCEPLPARLMNMIDDGW